MSLSDIQVEELLISAEQHLNNQPLRKSTIIEGPSVVANKSVVRSPEVHLKALPALTTNTVRSPLLLVWTPLDDETLRI